MLLLGMFAEMSSDQFLKRFKQIVHIYSSSFGVTDGSTYESIVHDNRLQWRMVHDRRRSSNLYAMALYVISFLLNNIKFRCNNIRSVSNRRSSSFSDINHFSSTMDRRSSHRNTFVTRRSTIGRMFGV